MTKVMRRRPSLFFSRSGTYFTLYNKVGDLHYIRRLVLFSIVRNCMADLVYLRTTDI